MSYDLVDFKQDVIDASAKVPVVIDFWAAWCGPCRMLTPVLEKLAVESMGKWKFVKINTEEHQQLAAQFGIRGIPNVKMVYQGKLIAEFSGALPEQQVRDWLKKHLPVIKDEKEDILEAFNTLLASGNRAEALTMAMQILEKHPDEKAIRAKAAMLLLPLHIDDAWQLFAPLKSDVKFEIEEQALQTIQHLISMDTKAIQGISSNVAWMGMYSDGISALKNAEFDKALDAFVQAIQYDRGADEDGARKACVAIFTLLGEAHPITKSWRRRFSMALY